MTKTGHQATGALSAFMLIAIFPKYPIPAATACVLGATAPDWLEIVWHDKEKIRHSLIPHRTLTHWLILWIAMAVLGLMYSNHVLGATLLGFAIGGLTHLAFDLPNPMGIPLLNPFKNTSLNLWGSGRYEWLVVSGYAGIAAIVFFIKTHLLK